MCLYGLSHNQRVRTSIMSKPEITSQTSESVTIEFTVQLDRSSMLKSEDNILQALNGAGRLAAEVALEPVHNLLLEQI